MPNTNETRQWPFHNHYLPWLVGVITAIISLLLFCLLIEEGKKDRQEILDYYATTLADDLIADLNRRTRAIKRMTNRWVIHNGLQQKEFEIDAAQLLHDEPGFNTIKWVDSNLVIRWISPNNKQQASIGNNLNNNAIKKAILEQAYKNNRATTTPPVIIENKELGFISYFPIVSKQSFAGFIVAEFTANPWIKLLIEQTGKNFSARQINIRITMQNIELWNDSTGTETERVAMSTVKRKFHNNTFTIKLTQPLLTKNNLVNTTSIIVLLTGLTFSFLLAGITALVQRTSSNIVNIKKSSSDLQNEKQRLASIIQGINAGTWEWNLQTKKASINETWANLIGYSLEELQPISLSLWEQYTHPDDYKASLQKLQEHLDGHSANYEVEIRMKHKNGQWVWIQDIGQIITRSSDGQPLMMYGTHTDISARKKIAQALELANEDLQHTATTANNLATEAAIANKAKSEFLASMSHEIRTPMNGIIGMLNLLMREHLTEKQNHFSTLALTSAKSLLTLINDILDFSKIEAGKMELESIAFDIHKFFSETAAPLALRAQEKGLELFVDYSLLPRCKLIGDPGRLRQILINLVGNSIKFTDSGYIKITPELKSEGQVAHLKCTISDTGIGIANDKLNSLFDSFTQVDTSTTRKYGGTGLGLAICRRLCELMKGKVIAASDIDKGSDFTFYAELENCQEPAKQLPWVDLKKHHILVVDSCAPQRDQLVGMLESWSAHTYHAYNAESAFKQLIQHPTIDIVIINMQLPDISGTQLALQMAQREQYKNQHRILLTSQGQGGNNQELIEFGLKASLTKPVSPSILFDTLIQLLTGTNQSGGFISITPAQAAEKPTPLACQSCRVLLVEDNPINQEVAQGLLQDLGFTVALANNGNEAIRALSSAPTDIPPFEAVFMDCQMPVMDGYEATRQIRAKAAGEKNIHIPIIAMTANAMTGDKEKCLRAGMNDYISKPIDPDKLIKALKDNISNKLLEPDNSCAVEQTIRTPDIHPNPPHNQITSNSMVWDKDAILRRVKNKHDRLAMLINMFNEDIPPKVNHVTSLIQQENYEEAKTELHNIKGVAGNLGGIALQQTCIHIEELLSQLLTNTMDSKKVEALHTELLTLHKDLTDFSQAINEKVK